MIADSTIRRVQDIPCEDVVGQYTKLVRRGNCLKASCPFHIDKKPSFSVSNNLWHCFSCGKGGDAISFVMEKEGLTYIQAVEHIAKSHNIPVDYIKSDRSDEELKAYKEREAILVAIDAVHKYFCDTLRLGTSDEARKARNYAYNRWGEEYCAKFGIGFAPPDSAEFKQWAKNAGLSEATLIKAGLMGKSEKGFTYPCFRNRITIPYRGRTGRIIAFTSRYMGDHEADKVGKYVNTRNLDGIFIKGQNLFGFNEARHALQGDNGANYVIAVEGAPDAMRLHIAGLLNTVAPLGTQWSAEQFDLIKPLVKSICFIPDSDPPKDGVPFGPGFKAVFKNASEAMRRSFDVTVREIPFRQEEVIDEDGNKSITLHKQDADDVIRTKEDFFALKEKPFLVWYAEKKFPHAQSIADERSLISEIAGLLASVKDQALADAIIEGLCVVHGRAKLWRDAVSRAKGEARRMEASNSLSDKQKRQAELLRQFNLDINENCYFSYDGDDEPTRLSNFILEPLYHIVDDMNGFRIFKVKNKYGQERDIVMRESEMCSLAVFKQRIGSLGNFIWRVKADKLENVKELIYRMTDSADRITLMGYDAENNFYTFGNGIFHDGEFHPADDLGIVRLSNGRAFFIPALAKMYRNDPSKYQFARHFLHENRSAITLRNMISEFVKVYGDNSKVAFCYVLATMFRDIIYKHIHHFPLLFMFGEKGSGKTTLAVCLQSFFVTGLVPPTLDMATKPTINDRVSEAVNSLAVFDEYKNDLHPGFVGFLKGLWNGVGQMKRKGEDAVQTFVTTGVAVCGQDKPTYDVALFSRVIYLTFNKTVFTNDELAACERLVSLCDLGNTHLTLEILCHRKLFEQNFHNSYLMTKTDVASKLDGQKVHSRVFDNWVVALSAFRTLEPVLDLPFSYPEMLDLCVKGILFQNENVADSSEISEFWQTLQGLHTSGKVQDEAHFVIKYQTSIQTTTMDEPMQFAEPTPIIYLNGPAVAGLFNGRTSGSATNNRGGWSTMLSYLKSHPCFLGLKQQRFNILLPNGSLDYTYETVGGVQKKKKKTVRPKALCFNYAQLKADFDLSLETDVITDDEQFAEEQRENNPTLKPESSAPSSLFSQDDEEDMPF